MLDEGTPQNQRTSVLMRPGELELRQTDTKGDGCLVTTRQRLPTDYFFLKLNFTSVRVFACKYVCSPHMYLMSEEPEEGNKVPGTGVIESCELLCVC